MSDRELRKYESPGPGRLDTNGVEWWACDPYPTWFRWVEVDGKRELHTNHAKWADEVDPRPTKQVIVMRTDLGMRKGKMIAQGAHASISFLSKAYQDETVLTEAQETWLEGTFTKVCVRVDSEDDLLMIYDSAGHARIPRVMITDAGKTEFGGVPTRTCVAIGPHWSDEIDVITGSLKLL